MNASKMLKAAVKAGVSAEEVLAELVSCRVEIESKHNLLMIKIVLKSKNKDIAPQVLCVPNIKKPSPALAC
ncbi:MAG: hypothetical protein KJ955_03815 [Nanoarchaeota archaeon]|nr:hypothetical protein [Nanoarchaeota archaeon]